MIKKNNNSNKKQSTRGLPVWNLADLYTSITSKKIYLDLTYVQKASIAFEKKYEGKITKLNSKPTNNIFLEPQNKLGYSGI